MGHNISKRVAAIVLAAAVCAGVTADSAYAAEIKGTSKQNVQASIAKKILIVPLEMKLTKEESSNILVTVVKKVEAKNNVKVKLEHGRIFTEFNQTYASILVTSADGRTGAAIVKVDIAGKAVIKFPDCVSVSSEASIIHDVKAEVMKTNKDGDIKSVDVSVKSKTCAHIKITDIWGNVFEKDVLILINVNVGVEKGNNAPVIITLPAYVKVGDTFDPLKGVMARDKEDGDLTDKLKVTKNTVDTSKAGKYEVEYSVTDSNGKNTVARRDVYVVNDWVGINSKPDITASNKTLKVGDKFNPLDGVTASDKEDGDLTGKVVVARNEVDTSKEGSYLVEYKVTDSMGASSTKDITVTVEKKQDSEKPDNGSDKKTGGTTANNGNNSNTSNSGNNSTTGTALSSLSSSNLPKTGGIGAALLSGIALSSMLSGAIIKKKHKK